jgi:hypothetical protein
VSEEWIGEDGLEVATLLESVERSEEDVLDLEEDVAVVGRASSVGEIERLLDAQRLPVIGVVLEAAGAFALFDGQNATSSDGDRVFRVAEERKVRRISAIPSSKLTRSCCSSRGSARRARQATDGSLTSSSPRTSPPCRSS